MKKKEIFEDCVIERADGSGLLIARAADYGQSKKIILPGSDAVHFDGYEVEKAEESGLYIARATLCGTEKKPVLSDKTEYGNILFSA